MASPRLRAYREDRPSLSDEPKYYARIPHDAYDDPRLSPRVRDVLGHLIASDWRAERTIRVTQAELAKLARCSVRTVHDALKQLVKCGYIRREREYRAVRHTIHLCYELRPGLKLEADETPVTSGSRSASNRQKPAASNRQKPAASNRQKPAAPTLFEREKEEERTTTEEKPESSSSFSASLPTPETREPEPAPKALESPTTHPGPQSVQTPNRSPAEAVALRQLCERAALAFPADADALLPKRVDEALSAWPIRDEAAEVVGLAIDYAGLKGARGWVYVLKTVQRWYADGHDLADARTEVSGARPRPRVRPAAEFHRAEPEPPADPETERRNAEALAEFKKRFSPRRAHEKPALGLVAKHPPTPAGVVSLPAGNPNRNGCSDQGNRDGTRDRAEQSGPPGGGPVP